MTTSQAVVSEERWKAAQKSEAEWWKTTGLGAVNSFHEEFKQHVYAERMGLEFDEWDRIDLYGRSILDIGGGPISLLLKTYNGGRRTVVDPLDMPGWAIDRYASVGIQLAQIAAEDLSESKILMGYDEVWLYNVLQHVKDPMKIIKNAMKCGKVVRVFEFLNREPNEGHPHLLTEGMLNEAFGQKGTVTQIKEPVRKSGVSAIFGDVYYGVFAGEGMSIDGMPEGIVPEAIELNWVNTGTGFPYAYYLAVMTALKTQHASKFNLWIVNEPSGRYYDALKNDSRVTIKHLGSIIPDFPALRGTENKFKYGHLVDYFRLKIIYDNGGVYADLDSISAMDYCDKALEALKEKEFFASVVLEPHIFGGGWFAARMKSPLVKLMLEKTEEKLQVDAKDFKWGNSGPDVINRVCTANLKHVYESGWGELGGVVEIYQLFNDTGALVLEQHKYIHVAANSTPGYWEGINEDYVDVSSHLYARLMRQMLSKNELHPVNAMSIPEWLNDSRNRYRGLYDIIKHKNCVNIMEIGVYNGQNALNMIKLASRNVKEADIQYFGFDLFDKITPEIMRKEYGSGPIPSQAKVMEFLQANTIAEINLFEGLTSKTLRQNVLTLPKMDLIFIDGGHSVETIRGDWANAKKLMKENTVVVFDDYYPNVDFIGCKSLLGEIGVGYQYEIMSDVDNHTAPWGPLKVQMLAVKKLEKPENLTGVYYPIRPDTKPVLHVLGLAHTKTTLDFSACAYTQKVFKMCKMMKALGYEVIHYGAEGSNPDATENVEVLSDAVQQECYQGYDWKKEPFRHDPTDLAYRTFDTNAIREINKRKGPKDLLLISMGNYQKPIADKVGLTNIESGIGYTGVFTDRRVFESYAWMFYMYGMIYPNQGGCDISYYDAVIPNYYDPKDFEFREKKDDYYLYIGRLIGRKGVHIAAQACERIGKKLLIAGQGTEQTVRECGIDPKSKYVEFVGYADVKLRSELMSHAKAVFVPTIYNEPFGGVNVEAMFCGTAAITSDFGGFTETVEHGKTGYRCRTMDDFTWAALNVDKLDPKYIREYAVHNYSLDRVGLMYDEYFQKVADIAAAGWYQLRLSPKDVQPGFPNSAPERTQLDWLRKWHGDG